MERLQHLRSRIRVMFDGLKQRIEQWLQRFIAENMPQRHYERYKEALVAELNALAVPSREGGLELEDVYCPVRLRRRSLQVGEEAAQAERRSWEAPMGVTQALLQSSRIVVLGGPGSGKTTLLRYLALTFAQDNMPQKYVRRLTFTHQDASMDHVIPIFVRLPEFAESGQDLLPYLVDLFADHGFPYAGNFLQAKLSEGRCLLLFDGLDGVTDQKEQERVIRQIGEVAGDWNQSLVSSRPAGYDEALKGFLHLELLPFDDEEIERFVGRWFTERSARAGALLAALERSPRMRSMAANPLLLSVLTMACDRQGLPSLRTVDLYDECVRILLGQEVETTLWICAQKLAYHFHTQRRACFSKEDLLTAIARILAEMGEDRDEPEGLLTALVDSTCLLRPASEEAYSFFHLGLQEYLVAKEVFENQDVSAAIEHVDDPWWREVIVLLAGLQRDATGLVEAILARSEDRDQALLFAARCLYDADWTEAEPRWKVRDGLLEMFERDERSLWLKASEAIVGMEGRAIDDVLLELLEDEDPNLRKKSVPALARIQGEGAVTSLVIALHDSSGWEVRERAAWALGEIGGKRVVRPLVRALTDDEAGVARTAAVALGCMGQPATGALIRALTDHREQVREMAVIALGFVGAPAVQPLISVLGDEDERKQRGAIEALGRVGAPAVAHLAEAVGDRRQAVRSGTVKALVGVGNEQAASVLVEMLGQAEDEDVVSALVSIGQPAIKPLIAALGDERVEARERAAEALVGIGEPGIGALTLALREGNRRIRYSVMDVLESIGQSAVGALVTALDDGRPHVRLSVAEILGEIGDEQAIQPLVQALEDEEPSVRAGAVESLERIGGEKVTQPLLSALEDEDERVRQRAAGALGRIGDNRAVESLIKLLVDADHGVRETARSALANIGIPAVEPLIAALYRYERDSTRQSIVEVLGEIGVQEERRGEIGVALAMAYHKLLVREHSVDEIFDALSRLREWGHWPELDSFFRTMARFGRYQSIYEIRQGDDELAWVAEISNWLDPGKREVLTKLNEVIYDVKRFTPTADLHTKTDALLGARRAINELREPASRLLWPEARALSQVIDAWDQALGDAIRQWGYAPQLECRLRSEQLWFYAPGSPVTSQLIVENVGFSAAQNVSIHLHADDEGAQFRIPDRHRWAIPVLPRESEHPIEFSVAPDGPGQLELRFTIRYEDQEGHGYPPAVFKEALRLDERAEPYRLIEENPYTIKPRFDARTFKGRKPELDWLRRNVVEVGQERQRAILVHGQRRIGKSWLVNKFRYDLLPRNYIHAMLDIQEIALQLSVPKFLYALSRAMSDACGKAGLTLTRPEEEAYGQNADEQFLSFSREVEDALASNAKGLVFVIDEFDLLVDRVYGNSKRRQRMPELIFEYLRGWVQRSKRIAVIFVGAHRVREQLVARGSKALLFSVVLDCPVSYLKEPAARELISEPLEGWTAVEYSPSAVDKIMRLTSSHPFFIQALCHGLVDLAQQEKRNHIGLPDVNRMLGAVILGTEDVFRYYLQWPSKLGQRVLAVLADATDEYFSSLPRRDLIRRLHSASFSNAVDGLPQVVEELLEYELISESVYGEEKEYAIQLPLFRMWLKQRNVLNRLREESQR